MPRRAVPCAARPGGGAGRAARPFRLNLIHVIKIFDLTKIGFRIQLDGSSLCRGHERPAINLVFFRLKRKYEYLRDSGDKFISFLHRRSVPAAPHRTGDRSCRDAGAVIPMPCVGAPPHTGQAPPSNLVLSRHRQAEGRCRLGQASAVPSDSLATRGVQPRQGPGRGGAAAA